MIDIQNASTWEEFIGLPPITKDKISYTQAWDILTSLERRETIVDGFAKMRAAAHDRCERVMATPRTLLPHWRMQELRNIAIVRVNVMKVIDTFGAGLRFAIDDRDDITLTWDRAATLGILHDLAQRGAYVAPEDTVHVAADMRDARAADLFPEQIAPEIVQHFEFPEDEFEEAVSTATAMIAWSQYPTILDMIAGRAGL